MLDVAIVSLFLVIAAAVLGGLLAKKLRFPPLVGYLLGGVVIGSVFPQQTHDVGKLAELGVILLLFSIGLELSFDRLSKYFRVATFGAIIQIVLVTGVSYFVLSLLGFENTSAIILALGFSLSSTAVVVKLLADAGELDTIHGGIMFGWLLVQDLAVVPILVLLPVLAGSGESILVASALSLGKALIVVVVAVLLGKVVSPFLIHKVASVNSRELLVLTSVALALGTAAATGFFGISAALGAFLAGVVISESQENHAVFAETRPLRDLFVALFFVSLGFLVKPAFVFSHLPIIITLSVFVIVLKFVVVFLVNMAFGYRGKTAIANSLGLAQIGEFAFVIFSSSLAFSLLSSDEASVGIATVLLTLLLTPILFKAIVPLWRKLRGISKIFSATGKIKTFDEELAGHIIICGFGRVGGWVGRAIEDLGIPFVVVDYNQNVVKELKRRDIKVVYGDPTEPEVLETVGIRSAKAIVLAIPDHVAQETLIAYIQTVSPDTKIISRAHRDIEWDKFRTLGVSKVVQPEFEAAMEIVKTILRIQGKKKDEIGLGIKKLRLMHTKGKRK
ncbi:cation:proton antiporter [Patescibacteria group bacterium]